MSEDNLVKKLSKPELQAAMWLRGDLTYKMHPLQVQMKEIFTKSDPSSILVWLLARQTGKSWLLAMLALEQALKAPDSIIKLVTDTKIHLKMVFEKIFKELLKDAPKDAIPNYISNEYIYYFPNGSQIQMAGTDNKNYERLRGQKCISSMISTPYGPKHIKDIKVGDIVYGYNEDGSVSESRVVRHYINGIKKVYPVYKKGEFLFSATEDHKFIAATNSSIYRKNPILQELPLSKINEDNYKILKKHINIPCGEVNEPHAYAIGAFLGDGCRTKGKNQIIFSSKDNLIPKKIAEILKVHYTHTPPYRWVFSTTNEKYKHSNKINLHYYQEWMHNRLAHEKTFDYEIVNTWNRKSCLKLIAGLVDTDGHIYSSKRENTLDLSITSTSKMMVDNLQKLFYKLFQVTPRIKKRKLDIKSIHQAYDIHIRSGVHVKRILKELTPFLVCSHKKFQPEYEQFHSKESLEFEKITIGQPYEEMTYDIEIDNKSHLYILGSGLVTHNSSLILVDEAGFCSDLDDVIRSVLIPTTTHTGGKVILATTPPEDSDHDFYNFMEEAEMEGLLSKFTIDDNPIISQEMKQQIEKKMGGRNSIKFRREYLVECIRDSAKTVIPEFTSELEEEIVSEYPVPPHFDAYVAMDLGGKDLTAVLFALYDFRGDKVYIQDELIMDFTQENNNLQTLCQKILKKEETLWTDIYTNEKKKPHAHISDIDYIAIKEITRISHGQLNFTITKKDDLASAINNVRIMLENKKIIIDPKCQVLLRHLRNVKWKSENNKTVFSRSTDNGHYDAVSALIYLIRNINFKRNPYPANYGTTTNIGDMFYVPGANKSTIPAKQQDIYKQILGLKQKPVDIHKAIFGINRSKNGK